jgi:ferric-dicitrate binding protein FerR (iron transport regulator)
MTEINRFDYLLDKYLAKTISPLEKDEFFELLLTNQYDDSVGARITGDYRMPVISQAGDLPPHIAQEIVRNILSAEKKTLAALPRPRRLFRVGWHWAAAAAILAVVVLSTWFFTTGGKNNLHSLADFIPDSTVKKTNTSVQPLLVALADGSSVTLQPGASIHYPRQFSAIAREVYLEGGAFFNVAKNTHQPFYVYYNNVVTRVLGTSFNVSTNQQTGNIEVAVQTGKVQVYENEKLVRTGHEANGVIVTPNQKAIYKVEQRVFEATLIEDPQPVAAAGKTKTSFVFEHIKLADLFHQLETRYAIEIVVENESIYNCVFSGDVSQQDLYGKLKIICLTTNADYEISGTKILIKGKGCN